MHLHQPQKIPHTPITMGMLQWITSHPSSYSLPHKEVSPSSKISRAWTWIMKSDGASHHFQHMVLHLVHSWPWTQWGPLQTPCLQWGLQMCYWTWTHWPSYFHLSPFLTVEPYVWRTETGVTSIFWGMVGLYFVAASAYWNVWLKCWRQWVWTMTRSIWHRSKQTFNSLWFLFQASWSFSYPTSWQVARSNPSTSILLSSPYSLPHNFINSSIEFSILGGCWQNQYCLHCLQVNPLLIAPPSPPSWSPSQDGLAFPHLCCWSPHQNKMTDPSYFYCLMVEQ